MCVVDCELKFQRLGVPYLQRRVVTAAGDQVPVGRMGDGPDATCVRVVDGLQQRSFRRIPQADRFIGTAGDEVSAVTGEGERDYVACVFPQGAHAGEAAGDAVHVDFRIVTSSSEQRDVGTTDPRIERVVGSFRQEVAFREGALYASATAIR